MVIGGGEIRVTMVTHLLVGSEIKIETEENVTEKKYLKSFKSILRKYFNQTKFIRFAFGSMQPKAITLI